MSAKHALVKAAVVLVGLAPAALVVVAGVSTTTSAAASPSGSPRPSAHPQGLLSADRDAPPDVLVRHEEER